ncbi:MAG: glycosyltransferase family 4 protein [Candidatus Peribacteraceae bacterium]|nr:glycosyltransferase family 4 protein [Candidatus Peribacteraceae bacterium]
MRITYVTQARFPTEKAHGFQVAEVCSALKQLKHSVTLVAPDVANTVRTDHAVYYGLRTSFPVVRLRVFDALRSRVIPGAFAFFFTMRSYRKSIRTYLKEHPCDLLYARSPALLPTLLKSGVPVILELHTLPRRSRAFIDRCRRCRAVVCLTTPMRDELLKRGMDASRVMVEGDGVDPRRFLHLPSASAAKKQWRLPAGRPAVGYVGSLVTRDTLEKGVRELIGAFAILKKRGEKFFGWVVGGPEEWRKRYVTYAHSRGLTEQDVHFQGAVGSPQVPSVLAACSVCVYPAPESTHPYFQRDTSPLKIFEYLAAGKPIVCANLLPLREVLGPSLAHLCRPGDSVSLADAIEQALRHPVTNARRRRALLERSSWKNRMARILAFAAKQQRKKRSPR